MLILLVVGSLIWVAQAERWTLEAWNLPTVYRGDAYEILARIKASSEGDVWPMLPQRMTRLGAPFEANWSAYPTPEKIQLLLLGGVAGQSNVFVAANLGLMLAFGLNALVFYWVVRRWLGARWEWAMMGALLFSFNYSVFHRGLAHFSFVFTWIVPLGLLASWLIARSGRLKWRSPGAVVCLVAGAAMGCHNTYYLFFWLQLMAWAFLAQWFGPRRRDNLVIGLATVGMALAVFLVVNFEYWAFSGSSDALPLLERSYGGTEHYALKIVEMFIPPAMHRWDELAFLGQRYSRWSDWRGEEFLPYLGLVGVAGLVWLVCVSVPRLLRGKMLHGQALSAGWLVTYSTIGGVTNFMAFFGGLFVFRATNRCVVFLAAIILTFLVVRLSRLSASWPAWLRCGVALALGAIGVADQLPRAESAEASLAIKASVASDQVFARTLEESLPTEARIFQLPVLGFPEVVPPWKLSDYEHFRPYLLSSTLRFSYGVPKFRPRGRWQLEIERRPVPEMVRRLEALGFSAIYVNRRGFEDNAEELLNRLAAEGYQRRITSPLGGQVAVLLNPVSNPKLPLARGLTFGRGWQNRPVDGIRWAYGDATMFYFNARTERLGVKMRIRGRVPHAQRIVLRRGLDELATHNALQAGEFLFDAENVSLEPGMNQFTLSGGVARREGMGANQLRAFGLISSEVTIPPGTGTD